MSSSAYPRSTCSCVSVTGFAMLFTKTEMAYKTEHVMLDYSLLDFKTRTWDSGEALSHLKAVLNQVEVLSTAGSGFSVVLQQDKQLLGQLVVILLHRRQRELQHPDEGLQSLGNHLMCTRQLAVCMRSHVYHYNHVHNKTHDLNIGRTDLHMHGVKTVQEERNERIQHLLYWRDRWVDLWTLQTTVKQLWKRDFDG